MLKIYFKSQYYKILNRSVLLLKAAYLAAFLKKNSIFSQPNFTISGVPQLHLCIDVWQPNERNIQRAKYVKDVNVDIIWTWNPCLYMNFFIPCFPCIITQKYDTNLQRCVFTSFSWPTSVRPSFPAWKALRVNSPASAGLMPGTLPEKQTHKHTGTHTTYKHEKTYEPVSWHASRTHVRTHKHTNQRGSNAESVCHSGFIGNKNRQLCRLKRLHFHCVHNCFSNLI